MNNSHYLTLNHCNIYVISYKWDYLILFWLGYKESVFYYGHTLHQQAFKCNNNY